MMRFLSIIWAITAIAITTNSIGFLPAEARGSINHSVRYDENFNPVICGTIDNDKNQTITGLEVTMHYLNSLTDDGWKQTKVVQVNIAPYRSGSFQIQFDKIANGKPAYMYTLSRIRFSNGTVSVINQTFRINQ